MFIVLTSYPSIPPTPYSSPEFYPPIIPPSFAVLFHPSRNKNYQRNYSDRVEIFQSIYFTLLSGNILILFLVIVSSVPISSVQHQILLFLHSSSIIIILISINSIHYRLNSLHATLSHYIHLSFIFHSFIVFVIIPLITAIILSYFQKYFHIIFIELSIHLSVVSFHRSTLRL